jgi:Phage stabilisation protein
MARIGLFGLGIQSKSPNVTSQRRLNIYYEMSKQEDKTKVVAYGTAGTRLFVTFGDTPCRVVYAFGNYVYAVHRNTFWQIDNSGAKVAKGTIGTTTGRISIADNGVQIMFVDGTKGYIYNTQTNVFAQITDTDFPANPNTVTFLARVFIATFTGTGRFYISAIDDGLSWNALDFANAESNPDNLVSSFSIGGQLVQFGEKVIEFWGITGGLDFPFGNIQGSALEYGLAARFSLVKFGQGLMFLARTNAGEVKVLYLQGYQIVDVTDHALANILNQIPTLSSATAFYYEQDGHSFYELNIGAVTWMYDSSTKAWTELKSFGSTRHLAECQATFLNHNLVSHYSNGNIYFLEKDVYSDNGDPIERELVSRHVFKDMEDVFISMLQIDMETGAGLTTGQGLDPQVMLQVSKDNGHTFGNERWQSFGKIGKYLTRVIWRQLGTGYDFVFKIRVTDPVKVVITGAYIE